MATRFWRPLITLVGLLLAAMPVLAEAPPGQASLAGFDCLIEPNTIASVSTREEGIISEMLVDRGDVLEKGQAIARLNSDVEEAVVALAKARTNSYAELTELREIAAYQKRELARYETLFAKQAVSAKIQDEVSTETLRAELQVKQALQRQRISQLEHERARTILKQRTITSPVAGVVVKKLMDVGESVDGRTIVDVASVNPLSVEVIVPVSAYGRLQVGDKAQVLPKYPGASEHKATVAVVDRIVDAASNTFGVRLELPNPDLSIPGGVRCEIQFLQ